MTKALVEKRPFMNLNYVGFAQIVRKFCLSSSLHGLKFIGDPRLHFLERWLWGCVFLSSLSFSLYLCFLVFKKWEESPVTIVLDSASEPASTKNFPAVTICNNNKAMAPVFSSFLRELKQSTNATEGFEEEMRQLMAAMTFVDSPINSNEAKLQSWTNLMNRYNIRTQTLVKALENMEPKLENQYLVCQFNNEIKNCSTLFMRVATDEGFCWKLRSKVRASSNATFNDGLQSGLSVLMNVDRGNYGLSSHGYDGFKVLIYKEESFSEVRSRGFPVGQGFEVFTFVQLGFTETSKDVLMAPADKQRCTLDGTLQYFTKYSLTNCIVECQLVLMLSKCGCLPYYLKSYIPGAKTCSIHSYVCLRHTRQEVFHKSDVVCRHCLPRCSYHSYSVSTSYAPYPGFGFESSALGETLLANHVDVNRTELSALHVFFSGRTALRYKRDIRYGWEDFISAVGGVLGLGIGFSLMTCMECVHFVFVWWFFDTKDNVLQVKPINKIDLSPVLPSCFTKNENCVI